MGPRDSAWTQRFAAFPSATLGNASIYAAMQKIGVNMPGGPCIAKSTLVQRYAVCQKDDLFRRAPVHTAPATKKMRTCVCACASVCV
jgi:hypothetical protein